MARVPRIGMLRHRVTLQAEVETADGYGGYALAWSDVSTFWARVEPLSGEERLTAMALEGRTTHRIWFRRRSDVTAEHRIVHGSRVFSLHSPPVNADERDRFQYVEAQEGGPV